MRNIPSPCGSRLQNVYNIKIIKGEKHLVAVGTTDIYDFVQSNKETMTVTDILNKAQDGDPVALQKLNEKRGYFADVSNAPSFAEACEKRAEAVQYFESLPLEVRREFGNSVDMFINSVADEEDFTNRISKHFTPEVKEALEKEALENSNLNKSNDNLEVKND